MSLTISSSLGAAYFPIGASSAGLQGQLAKYEKELAACVNCDSANTLAGKSKIAEVTARIAQIKERISQASEIKQQNQSPSKITPASEASYLGSNIDIEA